MQTLAACRPRPGRSPCSMPSNQTRFRVPMCRCSWPGTNAGIKKDKKVARAPRQGLGADQAGLGGEGKNRSMKFKKLLTPEYLKAADLSKGRLVFSKNCATCHRLYDDGGNIGPALTGSQRFNLDYVLENMLDPSAVVARDYQV